MAFQNLYPTGMRPKKATFGEKVQDALLNLAGTTAGAYLNRKFVQEPLLEQKHQQAMEGLDKRYEYEHDKQGLQHQHELEKQEKLMVLQRDLKEFGSALLVERDDIKSLQGIITKIPELYKGTTDLVNQSIAAGKKTYTYKDIGKLVEEARKDVRLLNTLQKDAKTEANKGLYADRLLAAESRHNQLISLEGSGRGAKSKTIVDPKIVSGVFNSLVASRKAEFAVKVRLYGRAYEVLRNSSGSRRVQDSPPWLEVFETYMADPEARHRAEVIIEKERDGSGRKVADTALKMGPTSAAIAKKKRKEAGLGTPQTGVSQAGVFDLSPGQTKDEATERAWAAERKIFLSRYGKLFPRAKAGDAERAYEAIQLRSSSNRGPLVQAAAANLRGLGGNRARTEGLRKDLRKGRSEALKYDLSESKALIDALYPVFDRLGVAKDSREDVIEGVIASTPNIDPKTIERLLEGDTLRDKLEESLREKALKATDDESVWNDEKAIKEIADMAAPIIKKRIEVLKSATPAKDKDRVKAGWPATREGAEEFTKTLFKAGGPGLVRVFAEVNYYQKSGRPKHAENLYEVFFPTYERWSRAKSRGAGKDELIEIVTMGVQNLHSTMKKHGMSVAR